MLKAVIFDLYETLVTHFDPDWKPPKLIVADRLGISEDDYREHWRRLDDEWQMGRFDSFQDLLLALCSASGHTPSESVIAELTHERSLRPAIVFEKLEPAIVEMVQELRARGFRLGVISNAGDLDAKPWPGSRLAPFFDVFVPSFQVEMMKPDTRIYEIGLRELGVGAEDAIYVGDGGYDELSGAKRAGLTALWATWFLDRWPAGIRPGGFTGDGWRQFPGGEAPFPRLSSPRELLDRVSEL